MKITLKAARVNAGLLQKDVVRKVGISKNTLVNYEKNKTSPNMKVAEKLAQLYGVSVNDLIFLESDCAKSTERK